MEGGNGVRGANGITHSPERRTFFIPCKCLVESDSRQSSAAEEISREVRKVRKVMEGGNGVSVSERSYALFDG